MGNQDQPVSQAAVRPDEQARPFVVSSNSGLNDVQRILGEAARYVIFIFLLLYSIGFLIWHAYLGQYGASLGFLQAEYLAAAVCYLFVSLIIGIPPFVLLQNWESVIKGKPSSESVKVLWLVWLILAAYMQGVFFPKSGFKISPFLWLLFSLAGLWVILYIIYASKRLGSKLLQFLKITDAKLTVGGLVLMYGWLSCWVDINKNFLFYTTIIYLPLVYLGGQGTRTVEAWQKSNLLVRILLVSLVCLVLIAHVQKFGRTVFGSIPRMAGGGEPETAFIKLNPNRLDLLGVFDLGTSVSQNAPKGFVGTISILLQTDKEIIFVDYAKLHAPENLTNVVEKFQTNITSNGLTNIVAKPETNIIKNVSVFHAKQIRADLVDALIFTDL